MSSSNVGLNLTTLATGTAIANISTNAGATNLDGTTNKMFIGQNCSYTQIATSTATNNAMTLPNDPVLGQTYTVRNDGAYIVNLFPGTTTSQFQYSGGLTTAGNAIQIGSGDAITVLCSSSNGAFNTNAGANPFNNPANIYQIVNESAKTSGIINVPAGGGALTLTASQSGSTIIIPILTAVGTCNLTTLLQPGLKFKFICAPTSASNAIAFTFTITATGLINGVIANNATASANALTAIAKAFNNTVQFTATAHAGDWVELVCDGTNWYVSGLSTVTAGLA
jgi:hypothetical protein